MRAEHSSQTATLTLARLEPGDCLHRGLLEVLDEFGVPAAVVASAIGSLSEVRYAYAAVDRVGQLGYSAPRSAGGPLEIASLQGHLGRTDGGEPQIHLHGAFVTSSGQVVAGHVLGGTVLVTVEVGLLSATDLAWRRTTTRMHPGPELPILMPVSLQPATPAR